MHSFWLENECISGDDDYDDNAGNVDVMDK